MPGPLTPVAAPVFIAKKKAVGSASARMANSAVKSTRAKTQSTGPARNAGTTSTGHCKASTRNSKVSESKQPLAQKNFPGQPAKVPSHGVSPQALKIPDKTSIPTTPHTPSSKSLLANFIKNIGIDALFAAATTTIAERKPDKAAVAFSLADLALLARSMHEDKRSGLTTAESLLMRVPQVAQTLVNAGITMSDIISKHLQSRRQDSHATANKHDEKSSPLQDIDIPDGESKSTDADTLDTSLPNMSAEQTLSQQKMMQIYFNMRAAQGRQEAAEIVDQIVKNLPDANQF